MKNKITQSKVTVLFMLAALIWVFFNIKVWKRSEMHGGLISYDVTHYYSYLPGYFIHDDLSFSFVDNDTIDYRAESKFFPVEVDGTDKYVVKVTMGMSMLYAPFFGIAHSIASNNDSFKADGFSAIYEFFLAFSGLFYTIVGFVFLRLVLLKYFSEIISSIVMLLLLFGTNLFYYCTSEPAMSHAYSFAMVAVLIHYTLKWLSNQNWKYMAIIGLVSGLMVLVRPINILVLLVILLFAINSMSDFSSRLKLLSKNWRQLILYVFCALVIVFPQLLYWKLHTGSWVFNSYTDEQFFWLNPHVLDGLFSYRKGWFLYTPLMIFACVGIFLAFKQKRDFSVGIIVFLPLFIYVTFSWWCWWYGGGFGARSMIDIYAILSLPLGVLIEGINKIRCFKWLGIAFFIGIITLNLIQTQQKRLMIIHWDSMNKEAYWGTFLKLDDQKNYIHLFTEPDYERAVKGLDEN